MKTTIIYRDRDGGINSHHPETEHEAVSKIWGLLSDECKMIIITQE